MAVDATEWRDKNFNDVADFPELYLADDQESLIGAGIRYRFREDIYLTIQYQQYSLQRAPDPTRGAPAGLAFCSCGGVFVPVNADPQRQHRRAAALH